MKIVFLLAFCLLSSAQPLRTVIQTMAGSQDTMGVFYFLVTQPALAPYFNVLNAVGVQKTVFIPINEALNRAGLQPNFETMQRLQAHTLPGRFPFASWNPNGNTVFSTLMTNPSRVQLGGLGSLLKGTRVGIEYTLNWGDPQNNATIDPSLYVECSDGIIYIIDTVMDIPPPLQFQLAAYGLTFFIEAVNRGQAQSIINAPATTIFVPDNDAFHLTLPGDWRGATPATWNQLIRFHSLGSPRLAYFSNFTTGQTLQSGIGGPQGRIDVTVAGAGVVTLRDYMGRHLCNVSAYEADIVSANGIIHVVDHVLIPNLAFEEYKKQ